MQTDHQQSGDDEQGVPFASTPDAIQRAIAGRYTLGIEEILTEAWALIAGYKLKLNITVAIYSAVAVVVALIVGGIQILSGQKRARDHCRRTGLCVDHTPHRHGPLCDKS